MPTIIHPPACTPFAAGYVDGYDGVEDGPVTRYDRTCGDVIADAVSWRRGYSAGAPPARPNAGRCS